MLAPTVNVLAAPDELILLDCLEQRVRRCSIASVDRAVVQQQPELVAAESRQRVVAAHAALQKLRELSQQLVARDVAAGIVDDLELIEIEVAHRVARAGRLRRIERALQADLELAAVDQAGERVVARFVRELPRQLVRLGDVGERALVVEDASVLVAHRARVLQHHDLAAVLAPEHQLGVADLARAPPCCAASWRAPRRVRISPHRCSAPAARPRTRSRAGGPAPGSRP